MGNLVLCVAIVVIVALIVRAADAAHAGALAGYTWGTLHSSDANGRLLDVAARIQPGREAVAAIDHLDLSPAQLERNEDRPCVYCRTFVPHTRALCFTTLDRYGQPALAPWVPIARDLRAQLVVASVATPLVRP